jgi:hypothetical protein
LPLPRASRTRRRRRRARAPRCARLAEAGRAAAAAEEGAAAARLDASLLRRGVELAAEQLTRAGGADVSAAVVLAAVRGQDEAAGLAAELADAREQAKRWPRSRPRART